MSEQLDLFAAGGMPGIASDPGTAPPCLPPLGTLDDDAVITALSSSNMADTLALAAEAGRRRLRRAVPVLERLCQRFAGFGVERPVPEQVAALEALGEIGDAEAVRAAARLVAKGVVQGPTLAVAVHVVGQLGAALPAATVAKFLRDPRPETRADACRCARPSPEVIAALIELLDDPHGAVRASSACALGRIGRLEARPRLLGLLRAHPSREVIEAVEPVADEACLVLLARIVRTAPALADCAREVLASSGHPRAAPILRVAARAPELSTDRPGE